MILGTVFCSDQSFIMHFIKNKKKLLAAKKSLSFILNRAGIKLSFRLKLLEVVWDQGLQHKEHIFNYEKKEVLAILALKQLKTLRLKPV